MGPRCIFASSRPQSGNGIAAKGCGCKSTSGYRHKRSPATWLSAPVVSNLVIDRPPANKPKLSYVGSSAAGTRPCRIHDLMQDPVVCDTQTLPGTTDHLPFMLLVAVAATSATLDGMCIDKASWQSTVDEKVSAPSLTKQDAAFEAENCQFVWGVQDLTVSDLNTLFQKVLLGAIRGACCLLHADLSTGSTQVHWTRNAAEVHRKGHAASPEYLLCCRLGSHSEIPAAFSSPLITVILSCGFVA